MLKAAHPGKEPEGSLVKNPHCSELTKAVPGQGTGALGHWRWLCCNITPGVKESQAPVSSHFTCGPWQVPAGCTVHRPAHQGARRKKRRDELQLSLSSPGREGTGEAGPALPLPSFWQAFLPGTQGLTTPESKRQGVAELAPSSGSLRRRRLQMPQQRAISNAAQCLVVSSIPQQLCCHGHAGPTTQPHATQRC